MEIKITKNAKYLHCYINPRFLDMASFNGQVDDDNGTLAHKYLPEYSFVPKENLIKLGVHKDYADGFIHLIINLDEGKIEKWRKDVIAIFNYKSCDENVFVLTDENDNIIHKTYNEQRGAGTEYLIGPKFLQDCGDYFCPTVDKNGKIKNYNPLEMQHKIEYWVNDVTKYFKQKKIHTKGM